MARENIRPERRVSIIAVKRKDMARSAEVLIDPSGTIRWRMVTENNFVRARLEQVLEATKALP